MPNANVYVRNCFQQYETEFPDDWIDTLLNWSNIPNSEASFNQGQKKINDFVVFCFVNIAKSLFSGEYIVHRKKFLEAKSNFEKYWNRDVPAPIIPGQPDDISDIRFRLYDLYRLLDINLKSIFDLYTAFLVAVDEKLDYGKNIYLLKGFTDQPNNIYAFRFFGYLKTFILPLCEYEHYLELSDESRSRIAQYIEELEIIHKREPKQDVQQVISLAIHKARFILKKLIRKDSSFNVLINCDKKAIDRNSIPSLPDPVENFFQLYEQVHEQAPYDKVVMHNIQIFVYQGKEKVPFLKIASLMHYYCSQGASLRQIDNLLKEFDETFYGLYHKNYHFDFDNHGLATLRNFLYNCRLSFRLNQNGYSLKDLEEDMDKIESLQNETLVCNFYPYKKALEHLEKVMKAKIEDRNTTYDYDSAINLFDKYLSKLDSNIDWCESHKFYPIQLPYKECVVEIDGLKLLLPSSITRPIDYVKLREHQKNLHASLEFFKTSLIYIKDRQDTESLKKDLEGVEKRYLEIGGVLIGVVTFLFGTINIFTQSDTPPRSMFFSVLGLGVILLIFACVIVLVSDLVGSRKPNVWKVIIFSLLLLTYSVLVAVMALNPAFLSDSEVSKTADSVKVKADSDSGTPSVNQKELAAPFPEQPIKEFRESSKVN